MVFGDFELSVQQPHRATSITACLQLNTTFFRQVGVIDGTVVLDRRARGTSRLWRNGSDWRGGSDSPKQVKQVKRGERWEDVAEDCVQGIFRPCVYKEKKHDIFFFFHHGDDLMIGSAHEICAWVLDELQRVFAVRERGVLGPDTGHKKEMT